MLREPIITIIFVSIHEEDRKTTAEIIPLMHATSSFLRFQKWILKKAGAS